jgi:serine/threonine protein kinase/Tfp pilus assembly protein PilF
MDKVATPSDPVADVDEGLRKCPRCGATTQLDQGTCINCFLRAGVEGNGEGSRETFESILAEANVTDTQWRLGHYEILEEIGRGGMGVIYRARQQHSRRIVAVKRMFAHDVNSHEALVRFRREAEAVASLDHPNILPIHEVSENDEGLPFFSMKYAAGGSLRAAAPALRAKPRECVQLVAKVARGIAYAHGKGVLHRDLQPGNILLDENGDPMVSDFGLAKWLDQSSDLTRTLETLGTPGYIAPEQAENRATDLTSAADIYSLGAILFYLLTGRPPFVGPNVLVVIHQAAATPAPRLRSLAPSLDRDLETIVARCLESDPKARYESAGALADDLDHWLRHEPIRARRSGVFSRGRRWVRRNPTSALLAASLVALAAVIGWNAWKSEFIPPPITNGIAVLPFENLSPDPDNAYFAKGIQDEILTRLASIADLKVISRASTQRYQSKPKNLAEIAKQLGVTNTLEGSVQRAADQERVNVQLVNAQTDSELWAETYDRKLTDILGVESEIAKRIAESLQAKLTLREQQALALKPTNNPEAYDAYLRGLAYTLKTDNTPANSLGAQKYLREAIRLDPKFALAWALLSHVDARGYITQTLQPTVTLREEARQAAETALTLQPDLGEGLLAKGQYHYACLKDYDTAVRYYEQARQFLPNSNRIPELLAYVARRRGQWDRSESYFNKAERLDPRNVNLLTQQALSYMNRRRFPEALRKLDQVLDITPDNVDTLMNKAAIAQAQGDLPRAAALLAPLRPGADDAQALETQVYQAILERRPAQMISRLQEILARPDPALGYINGRVRVWLGWAQDIAGDHIAAQKSWQQARSELELFLKEQPENWVLIEYLALTNMGLGDKDAAFALAERGMVALPFEKDAFDGPGAIEILARVAACMGKPDRAIAALQKLLSIPYEGPLARNIPLTPALLRLDPMFDSLRNDLRFQKLCDEANEPVALK